MIKKVMIGAIKLYQWLMSPILGHNCRFYPSCSKYAIGAIKNFGPIEGLLMAFWRLLRCGPWSDGGYDPPIKSPFRRYGGENG